MEDPLLAHLYIISQNTHINAIFNLMTFKRKAPNALKLGMKSAPRMKAVKFTSITPMVQV